MFKTRQLFSLPRFKLFALLDIFLESKIFLVVVGTTSSAKSHLKKYENTFDLRNVSLRPDNKVWKSSM